MVLERVLTRNPSATWKVPEFTLPPLRKRVPHQKERLTEWHSERSDRPNEKSSDAKVVESGHSSPPPSLLDLLTVPAKVISQLEARLTLCPHKSHPGDIYDVMLFSIGGVAPVPESTTRFIHHAKHLGDPDLSLAGISKERWNRRRIRYSRESQWSQ